MSSQIVEARPDHARFVGWVGLTAARSHLPRGFWDFYVEGEEDRVLDYLETLAITPTRHWAHHSTFLIAEVDGSPAAAMCGYFEAELGMTALRKALVEADERAERPREELERCTKRILPIMQVIPDHETGVWIVENVATRPEYRRRGLVDALLAATLERGRELGATRAGISVLIGNDPAQRAYEKAGFRVFQEKRNPDFEALWGCPGIRALERSL